MSGPRPAVRLYAHRGAAVERPENTLASFARALELGAHALELDVHLTADGQVVVSHDPDGRRMAGAAARIDESRWDEVRRWDAGWGFLAGGERPFAGQGLAVPRLEEVLEAFPGAVVNVDLKPRSQALVRAFLARVHGRGDEERVIAASFHRGNLAALREAGWRGLTGLAQAEVLEWLALPAPLWRRLPGRGRAAQLPTRVLGLRLAAPWLVRRARACGLRVDFWTVNDPEEARALLALGADGLMTDDPGRIAPVVRAWEGQAAR